MDTPITQATKAETVRAIVERFLRSPTPVEDHQELQRDLQLDSLDHFELVMAVEDEFGISIDDADARNLRTVRDFVDHVERATA